MFKNKSKLLTISTAIVLGLSVAAVYVRANGYYNLPSAVRHSLENFATPGETIWWLTIGGFFEGYPSDMLGYLVLILSNTIFWIITGLCLWGIFRSLRLLYRSYVTRNA